MGKEDLADFAVKHAQKLGATYAEARYERTKGSGFSLKNGIPQLGGLEDDEGIAIRLIYHGALEFASTDWMDKAHVKELVEKAVRGANANARLVKTPIQLASEDRIPAGKCVIQEREKIEDFDVADKYKLLFRVEKALKDSKLKIPARYFYLSDEVGTKYYTNSEGTCIDTKLPRVHFTYVFTVAHNSHTKQRYFQFDETSGYEALKKWNLEKRLVDEAKGMHENLTKGVSLPSDARTLIIAPEITGIACHESVGHPYEADRIMGREAAQAGESFLTPESIGMKIGSELVNVVDDPTIEHSAGFYLYDDEGVKARRKNLISGGIVSEFLHNRETGWRMELSSNGSSRSQDYQSEAIVRMSNTFHLPGDTKPEDLIGDVKKGVYFKSFMEWNIDDKRLNQRYVSNEAYLIEKGEVTKPIRRVTIETSTPDFWGAVTGVGSDLDFVAGTCGKGEPMQGVPAWMGGPHLRFDGLRLVE